MSRLNLNLLSLIAFISLSQTSLALAQDHIYESEIDGISIQAKVIPSGECKHLFHDFPHDDMRYPHSKEKPTSSDAYKELFAKDFAYYGVYPVGLSITNSSNKPVYLTQESIKLKRPAPESKQCLIDQAEISTRRNVWLLSGVLLPVIGWFLLFSSMDDAIGNFIEEHGIPADGITLKPGTTFRTVFFVDNHLDRQLAPTPESFDLNFKVYTQLSWYKTKYTKFTAQLVNNNRKFV